MIPTSITRAPASLIETFAWTIIVVRPASSQTMSTVLLVWLWQEAHAPCCMQYFITPLSINAGRYAHT